MLEETIQRTKELKTMPLENGIETEKRTMSCCMCIIYRDTENYNCDTLLSDLSKWCETNFMQYSYIYHDNDYYLEDTFDNHTLKIQHYKGEKKKEHYHFVIKFNKQIDVIGFSQKFNIPQNQIEIYKPKNLDKALIYLTHVKQKKKYQYSYNDVLGNISDYVRFLNEKYISTFPILRFVNESLKNQNRYITKSEMLNILLENGFTEHEYKDFYNIIRDLLIEHNDYSINYNKGLEEGQKKGLQIVSQIKRNEDNISKLTNIFDTCTIVDEKGNKTKIMSIGKENKK